jgi:hypothetical protein
MKKSRTILENYITNLKKRSVKVKSMNGNAAIGDYQNFLNWKNKNENTGISLKFEEDRLNKIKEVI